jgi:hypothetical protein
MTLLIAPSCEFISGVVICIAEMPRKLLDTASLQKTIQSSSIYQANTPAQNSVIYSQGSQFRIVVHRPTAFAEVANIFLLSQILKSRWTCVKICSYQIISYSNFTLPTSLISHIVAKEIICAVSMQRITAK